MARGVKHTPAITGDEAEGIIEGELLTEEQYELVRPRATPPPRPKQNAELTKAVGAEGQLSGLDARLLRLASSNRSPEEIAEEIGGISAARAAQRVREILSSRDWLSESERELILMNEMIELKDRLKALVEKWDDADYLHGLDPRMIGMLQKMLTDLMKAVEQRRKAAQNERVSIRAAHAKLIVSAIEGTFSIVMHDLGKHYKIDEGVARDILESALPRAIAAIEAQADAA